MEKKNAKCDKDLHKYFIGVVDKDLKPLSLRGNRDQLIVEFIDQVCDIMFDSGLLFYFDYLDLDREFQDVEVVQICADFRPEGEREIQLDKQFEISYSPDDIKRLLARWACKVGMDKYDARHYRTIDDMYNQLIFRSKFAAWN
jgi:hypothetical protein